MATQPTGKVNINEHRKTTKGDDIGRIFDTLNTTSEQSVQVLPEEIFINNFLPLFAGEKGPESEVLNIWFGIAGNPYMPVKISGKDGEILYTVPPFFDRGAVRIDRAGANAAPISHIVTTTEQLTKIHPRRGEAYFEDQINRRNIVDLKSPQAVRNSLVWVDIFERYKMPVPEYLKQVRAEAKPEELPAEAKKDKPPEEWDLL